MKNAIHLILLSLFVPTTLMATELSCPCHTQANVREGNVVLSVCKECSAEEKKRQIETSHAVECTRRYGGRIENYKVNPESCQSVE